jgi:ATP-dependent Clp protease, protease subunit
VEQTIKSAIRVDMQNDFVARPERTIQWFGGVTHQNLENTIEGIHRHSINNPEEEIQLLINSHGGSTGIAMSFYDYIHSVLKPNLVTIGSGDVDSSGIIIFLAGKKRYLTKNTTLLFHMAGRTFGTEKRFTVEDMRAMVKEDSLKDYQYASVVAEATSERLSSKKVLEMMHKNTILTAEEAVSLGLAHRVL